MKAPPAQRTGLVVLVIALLLLCAITGVIAWLSRDVWWPELFRLVDAAVALLKQVHPVFFFLMLAVLPAFSFPITPFYLTAGIYPLYIAIPGVILGILCNLSIAYWLADTFLNGLANKLLERTRFRIPRVTRENAFSVGLMVRLSGIPYAAQNFGCALAGVPYPTYILVSLPVQLTFAFGFMLVGESLMQGESRMVITAVVVLILLVLTVHLLRGYFIKRKKSNLQQGELPLE